MIEQLPNWINFLFLGTLIATLGFFYIANGKPKKLMGFLVIWCFIQGFLGYAGFYRITDSVPPRFALVLLPILLFWGYGLRPTPLKAIITVRTTHLSTFLHTVRIPVEIVLWYLYRYGTVPELMTFEGRNFDILVGITAPLIGSLFYLGRISKKALLAWNVIGLFLVFFILINGILSAELPFQQFAFDRPNTGITYFPFVLLPAAIVPLVIYTHITDIIKLRKEIF